MIVDGMQTRSLRRRSSWVSPSCQLKHGRSDIVTDGIRKHALVIRRVVDSSTSARIWNCLVSQYKTTEIFTAWNILSNIRMIIVDSCLDCRYTNFNILGLDIRLSSFVCQIFLSSIRSPEYTQAIPPIAYDSEISLICIA